MHSFEQMRYRKWQDLSEHFGEGDYMTFHVSLAFKKRVEGQKYNVCECP